LQNSYLGKIKMIYIDPPYNTGKDFVYKDNYKDNLENYLEQTNTTGAVNSEASGRFHTNWLNMIYPRLRLARNLLTDDGVIFISIGQQEINNILSVCNELFGEDNQIGVVSRIMKSGSAQGDYFSPNVEYILVYAKNELFLNKFKQPLTDEIIKKLYTSIEKTGKRKGEKYRPFGLYQSSLDPLRGCSNQRYYIEAPDGTLLIPPGNAMPKERINGAMVAPQSSKDKVWRWSRNRFLEEVALGNIEFKESDGVLIDSNGCPANWNVYSKIWLKDRQEEGMTPVDLITKWENRISKKELQDIDIPFDFAKPSELIKYLISIIGAPTDSIFLDFFSGSATTAHAVMQLNAEDGGNRKYICVQLPEQTPEDSEAHKFLTELGKPTAIPEIAKERIRRAGKKIAEEQSFNKIKDAVDAGLFGAEQKEFAKLDIGFKVFKLDRSNVKNWDLELNGATEKEAAEQIAMALNNSVEILKADRTESDLLYEVMLKLGLKLSDPIEEVEIDGHRIFVVGYGLMVVTFAKDMSYEQISKMLDLRADFISKSEFKVVIADQSFATDNDKTNALQLFKQKGVTNFEII
ncbi:MAG: site-specific DNA-methyltransferase, partial [Rikenellaceae bacterium]